MKRSVMVGNTRRFFPPSLSCYPISFTLAIYLIVLLFSTQSYGYHWMDAQKSWNVVCGRIEGGRKAGTGFFGL